MTVLLTGGSGFLGSHVAEQLSQAGRPVKALVRRSSDTRFLKTLPHVELVEGAVEDAASVLKAAEGCNAIVHAAGLVKARDEDEFFRVNVGGTENVVAAAASLKGQLKKLVLVSSLAAAGPSDSRGTPLTPDMPPRPLTRYGRSKRAAERVMLVRKDELPVVILRPSAIYGPRDKEVLTFFKAVKARLLPYFGSTKNKLTMIYGADCGAACIAAIDADVPSGAIHFVDDGNVYTFEVVYDAVEKALGQRALVRFPLPRPVVYAAALGSELYGRASKRAVMLNRDKLQELYGQFVSDSSSARTALGWEPKVFIDEGAKLTADWYQANGWL